MRETKTFIWCDVCNRDLDTRTEATSTWTVGISDGERAPSSLGLAEVCDMHRAAIDELVALMDGSPLLDQVVAPRTEVAKLLSRPSQYDNQNRIDCPICGESYHRYAIVDHVWRSHRADARPPTPLVCPECHEEMGSKAGMGSHRIARHGYDPLIDALSGVPGYLQGSSRKPRHNLAAAK